MSEEKQDHKIKVKLEQFAVDNNLMYLIQGVTKLPTQDILGYFYSMANTLTEEGLKHCKARQFKRRLDYFYPDTPIPFRLEVWSNYGSLPLYRTGDVTSPLKVHVEVSFPKKAIYSDVSDMVTQFTEVGLGLVEGEDLPKFDKPATRIPRGMRNKV